MKGKTTLLQWKCRQPGRVPFLHAALNSQAQRLRQSEIFDSNWVDKDFSRLEKS